jgi:hypothetical protein
MALVQNAFVNLAPSSPSESMFGVRNTPARRPP